MPGPELVPGYRSVRFLGRGNFGEVWCVETPGGIEVVIKVINRPLDHVEARRELQSPNRITRLRHPVLLQTQVFWTLEDRLLIAMERADGSLRDRWKACVREGRPGIPAEELMDYVREACEALDLLHSRLKRTSPSTAN